MCEPATLTAIALGVSALSAGLSIAGQSAQHDAQEQYQSLQVNANKEQMRENRELATKAYLDQATAANENLAQTREAAAVGNFDQTIKRHQAQGATLTAAAEGGVDGVSLNAILADFHRQEDMFLSRSEQNLLFKQQQTGREVSGLRDQANGRINQLKPFIPGPIAPVDYFSPVLGIASQGINTYVSTTAATKKSGGSITNNYYNN